MNTSSPVISNVTNTVISDTANVDTVTDTSNVSAVPANVDTVTDTSDVSAAPANVDTSAPANTISIVAGSIISCVVASLKKHPEGGLIVAIEGNPNGFIPTSLIIGETRSDKTSRRDFLIKSAGKFSLECLVKEAHMLPDDSTDLNRKARPARARIILDEEAVLDIHALESDQRYVESLVIGAVMKATILHPCMKKNDDGEGEHQIGFVVQFDSLNTAFLHKSEVAGALNVGDYIDVSILSATMQGNRPRISVSQKAVQAKQALDSLKAGSKTTGHNLRAATVNGIDGFTMEIGKARIKAFLPLTEVNGDPASLLKGSRSAKVTVLAATIDKFVQVTRRLDVTSVVSLAAKS